MLVRVSYTEAASVGANFDESQDRVNPHIQSDNWIEYIVAWRKERLELYRDHVGLILRPCTMHTLTDRRQRQGKNGS